MGRRRRLFQGPAREAAKLLVLRCEHPGCELPADLCDVDHADEWTHGGPTDQHNSRIRCGTHNADKTKHRWRSKRAELVVRVLVGEPEQAVLNDARTPVAMLERGGVVELPTRVQEAEVAWSSAHSAGTVGRLR